MKNIDIRTFYKLISKDIVPKNRTEILVSFIMFGHEINLKGLCLVLSAGRVKWISLLEIFCKSFYFLLLNQKILKGDFREVFLLNLCLQSLGIMTQFLLKSWVENETWLKKSTKASNYGKFICNIFRWDTIKIGIIRAKVQFSMWI